MNGSIEKLSRRRIRRGLHGLRDKGGKSKRERMREPSLKKRKG
jgi:hypothetical protein